MKTTPPAKPMPPLKKEVGIWIRVSTEDQAHGDSPKHHETRARAYAESRGWTVRELYDLAGVSGKSVADHPEAKRMMEDVTKGKIQALIFSKLARLARNTRELLDFADFFQKHDADLVSLQESIDTSTPAGRLFYTMIAAMAQWEREEITDRVRATVAVRAKAGKPLNGKPVFGYHFVDNKIQLHPTEAPIRKLIYELYAEHKRKKAVVRILNERGFRTRNNRPFTPNTLEYLIRDTTAKGEYRSNYTKLGVGDKHMSYKPEHEWVVNTVPPIVSNALWKQCNGLLDNRKAKWECKPGPKTVHPFAGFVVCHCGDKMYVKDNTPKYVCRKCHIKIPIDTMDALFHKRLTGYLLDPEKAEKYVKSASEFLSEKTAMLEALRAELRGVKTESEKLFQLYYAGGLTTDQFKAKFEPIDARSEQIDQEIAQTEAAIAAGTIDGISSQQIMADAKQLYESWPTKTPEEKRHVVESVVRQITVHEREVEIDFVYLPFFEDMGKRVSSPGPPDPPQFLSTKIHE